MHTVSYIGSDSSQFESLQKAAPATKGAKKQTSGNLGLKRKGFCLKKPELAQFYYSKMKMRGINQI